MITTFLVTIVLFLTLALTVSCVETESGYLGDSSLVPGCIGCMVAVLIVELTIGHLAGWIKVTL